MKSYLITSNQIIKLSEEWLMSIPSPFKSEFPIDIYVNPSSSDLIELKKSTTYYVRFIADSRNKKLYVWNGETLLHAQVARHLNLNRRIESIPDQTLIGTADIRSGRLYARYSDYLYSMLKDLNRYKSDATPGSYIQKQLNYFLTLKDEFNWMIHYMDISEILNLVSRNLK